MLWREREQDERQWEAEGRVKETPGLNQLCWLLPLGPQLVEVGGRETVIDSNALP